MDISFECPHCSQQIVIDEAGAGLQVDCPRCQSSLRVPRLQGENPQASPPSENGAQYRCNNPHCGGEWSERQLLREIFEESTILLCPKCRFGVTKITPPAPFWSQVTGAFAYPFLGSGIWILVSGTVLLPLLDFAQRVAMTMPLAFSYPRIVIGSLIVGGIAIGVIGCFGMLLLDIIRTTAIGEEKTMEWPDVGGWDDLREAALLLGGSALVVFLPAMICTFFARGGHE
jgi:DNA-directed RNA polymerase subunit RPC12/RpoP